jgi:TRAF3-interacting protein 1
MCENWQTTAQMFSSLFEKPKMSEKLLSKPPFKYIFDIFTETMKSTGFAQGLYSEEEMNAQFYNDKDTKITYLKKMTDLV